MRTLSILQPYAWLIVNGYKDIENRTWYTPVRGQFLVHAGKKYGPRIHADYVEDMQFYGVTLPSFAEMMAMTGGIVGLANITDCVKTHPSKWKMMGTWGFVLNEQAPLPFRPWRGQLGFFDVPDAADDKPPTSEQQYANRENHGHFGAGHS